MNLNNLTELQKKFPSLIPLNGKIPIEKGWQQWCEKPRALNLKDFHNRNAGIPCGPANQILVIDVDHIVKFNKICETNGWKPPRTRTHLTGTEKPHYVYEYPKNGKRYGNRSFNDPDGEIDPKTGKVIKVFDIRGIGGQVVAPGSIHPDTGKPYTIRHDIPIAPAPQWLLNLALQQEPQTGGETQREGNWDGKLESLPLAFPVKKLIQEGEPKGRRSEAIASVLSTLLRARIPESTIFGIFDTYPIGDKYRGKGRTKEQWLRGEIKRIGGFIDRNKKEPEKQSELIAFPDVMTGVAGKFASLYSSHLEAPIHFFYMSFLTCLGSVIADRATLALEITPQSRLYLLILGQSADDRKSTAIDKTVRFFQDTMESFPTCWGVGSAEGLQRKLKKNPSTLLCLDEFKQFIGKCTIKSSILLPCVNSLFESNRYESWTQKREIVLENVYLSLLAASTIETYERTWERSFTDIGFNNRLFLVPGSGKKRFSMPSKVPDNEIYFLRKELQSILSHVGNGLELEIAEDAKLLYHDWYMNMERSIHTKRLDTYALRLMVLLAVNDMKNAVDTETVSQAIALCDWQLEVRRIHDPIDADNNVAKMEEKIRRVLNKKSRTDRELKQYTNARQAGLWFFDTAKKNLQRSQELRWNKKERVWEIL